MKIIKYENYNTTPLPSEFVRVHCDGNNYFFAENEEDVAEIEASLPVAEPEVVELPKVDLSNIDLSTLSKLQIKELKKLLGL